MAGEARNHQQSHYKSVSGLVKRGIVGNYLVPSVVF